MQQISPNAFAHVGFVGCNVGFVATSDGVVMVDTPQLPSQARGWLAEIKKHGPVRYVINTEPHADHFMTNYLFGGVAVAHEGTREAILAWSPEASRQYSKGSGVDTSYLDEVQKRPPEVTFSRRLTLYCGKHTFDLINMPGHTPFQTAVHVPEEKVVFTSDNVFCRVQAWLQTALPYDWLASLRRLRELDARVLVPGHGQTCGPEYLDEMAGFVQAWIDAVADAKRKGWTVEEAQDRISLLDRYPMQAGTERLGPMLQKMNVAHLYEVVKP